MTNQEIIAVVQAHSEGKQIEAKSKDYGDWHPANPDWNFDKYDYRVKHEPREGWVPLAWLSRNPSYDDGPDTWIHVREIL